MKLRNRRLLLQLHTNATFAGEIVERRLREAGIHIPPYLFGLLATMHNLGPSTPSKISATGGMPMTTLRDNIQRLVDRKLVRRKPNPADGRSYLVEVTRRGELAVRTADPALAGAYDALEEELKRPLERYQAALDEIGGALERVLRRPVSPTPSPARARRRAGSAPRRRS
jgi:DNA-binding MarR family transcriptional regulator